MAGYIFAVPRMEGTWERGSGRRDLGLEAEGPFLCSATVTGIVSDDEKTETRTAPTGHRRNQSATPIPGRRCADGQTARQRDSQTARQLADPPPASQSASRAWRCEVSAPRPTGRRLCWARWALTRAEAVGGQRLSEATGHRNPSEPPTIRASLL
jgi:hypothetical protein